MSEELSTNTVVDVLFGVIRMLSSIHGSLGDVDDIETLVMLRGLLDLVQQLVEEITEDFGQLELIETICS